MLVSAGTWNAVRRELGLPTDGKPGPKEYTDRELDRIGDLYFPGQWYRSRFATELVRLLKQLRRPRTLQFLRHPEPRHAHERQLILPGGARAASGIVPRSGRGFSTTATPPKPARPTATSAMSGSASIVASAMPATDAAPRGEAPDGRNPTTGASRWRRGALTRRVRAQRAAALPRSSHRAQSGVSVRFTASV
jgi:hypothetical protein